LIQRTPPLALHNCIVLHKHCIGHVLQDRLLAACIC
jgi:hypothetical protein